MPYHNTSKLLNINSDPVVTYLNIIREYSQPFDHNESKWLGLIERD